MSPDIRAWDCGNVFRQQKDLLPKTRSYRYFISKTSSVVFLQKALKPSVHGTEGCVEMVFTYVTFWRISLNSSTNP